MEAFWSGGGFHRFHVANRLFKRKEGVPGQHECTHDVSLKRARLTQLQNGLPLCGADWLTGRRWGSSLSRNPDCVILGRGPGCVSHIPTSRPSNPMWLGSLM